MDEEEKWLMEFLSIKEVSDNMLPKTIHLDHVHSILGDDWS